MESENLEISPKSALLDDLDRFGDRSSSFISTYPGFTSFHSSTSPATGQIRYVETKRAWVGAAEPLASQSDRDRLFREFAQLASTHGKRAIQAPVTEAFAKSCHRAGLHAIQIGSEAVVELSEYFQRAKNPLDLFPHARSLLKRGARVQELEQDQLTPEHEARMECLTQQWRDARSSATLGFLNQVAPLYLKERKRIFALFLHDKIIAFLSAVPIEGGRSFFFADYIREASSRSGTMELLFIESMRQLKERGCKEVRFGLCPFANLANPQKAGIHEKLLYLGMNRLFKSGRYPLNFQSIYRFKAKFEPTRWEPLFLVSNQKVGLRTLRDISDAILGRDAIGAWLSGSGRKLSKMLRADETFAALPKSAAHWISQSGVTISLVLLFAALHVARLASPQVQSAYEASGYVPGNVTAAGVFAGSLFHNNGYHLFGDLLSFLIFGSLIEVMKGRALLLTIVATGLWLSNPLTHAAVGAFLPGLDPVAWTDFSGEQDYGSSNAVYALVGALAALMRNPRWLLAPFMMNALFLCVSKNSWLSLHHLAGLGLGYVCVVGFRLLRRES